MLTKADRQVLLEYQYCWKAQARDKQYLPPGNWSNWLIRAGRGFGKTRTGSETVRIWKDLVPIIHMIARTTADIRDTMIEGPGGIIENSPPWDKPEYLPSLRKLQWKNGSYALLFTAEEPDQLRGPQCYKAWADELCAWSYDEAAWDMLNFGLRLGTNPQVLITTTPINTPLLKKIRQDVNTLEVVGSTYENRANLSEKFFEKIITKYEGTRLGRQELDAEILEDIEGALWTLALIERNRVTVMPQMIRIVVAIDPAVTSGDSSDETGIVVTGLAADKKCYVLADLTGKYTPYEWGRMAVNAYHDWQADKIIAEVNNGGDLVKQNIKNIDPSVNYGAVSAARGKVTRAEPIVSLYEQDMIRHVGYLPRLENEMTSWVPANGGRSPNHIDALVWSVFELAIKQTSSVIIL